nr:SCO family protein [Pseudoflavitalea sp. G-6-1-2]
MCVALILPVASYFLVKGISADTLHMPKHFYAEDTKDTLINGKLHSDTIWHQVANFELTNQLGQKVRMDDMRGKIIIANYFFTRCPSICPALTRNMKMIQDGLKLRDITKRIDTTFVQLLSFSVDPERDSVPVLKAYADRNGVNHDMWWMLTGPKKTIYDYALNELKLGLQDGGQVDSAFIHTEKFIMIDKRGVIRGYYNGLDNASLSKLAEDLTLLMLEKDKGEKSPILAKLLGLWPVYLIAIVILAVFVRITRKPNKKQSNA